MTQPTASAPPMPRRGRKFRETAQAAGGALDSVANSNRGPDGGDLSTDIAWFGPRDAEKVLVMVSGTHGAEGFCGLRRAGRLAAARRTHRPARRRRAC
ncbi:MAG: DUF2817 domain-containing protein [Caulobacteraceae bacterium]